MWVFIHSCNEFCSQLGEFRVFSSPRIQEIKSDNLAGYVIFPKTYPAAWEDIIYIQALSLQNVTEHTAQSCQTIYCGLAFLVILHREIDLRRDLQYYQAVDSGSFLLLYFSIYEVWVYVVQ